LPLPCVREAPPGCGVPAGVLAVAPFVVVAVPAGFVPAAVGASTGAVVEGGVAEVSTPGFTS